MITLALLFFMHAEAKQVCAPSASSASFSMGCKMVSEEKAKVMQAKIDFDRGLKQKKPGIKIGMYSGRVGYYIIEGGKTTDAVVMNPSAGDKLLSALEKLGLGQTRECEIEGMHQSIGYTIFDIMNCK